MFNELPKLFDKNFAIAYFLPSVGFVIMTYFLITRFKLIETLFDFSKESLLNDVALIGLAALVLAVILSVFNRKLVRFMEGYWSFSLFGFSIDLGKYLNWLELRRYKKLETRKEELTSNQNEYDEKERKKKLNRIEMERANEFPIREDLILPTSFGNTYRAFESYAQAMYGIDAIIGWYRLYAVIPQEFSSLMNDARARVDFGVNLWFLSILLAIEYIFIAIYFIPAPNFQSFFSSETLWWLPLLMLVISYISFSFAKSAIAIWGNWVKAAFDLYLPELRKKMEFPTPETREEEIEMWRKFGQAVHYRLAKSLPEKKIASSESKPISSNILNLSNSKEIDNLIILNTALQLLQRDFEAAIQLLKKDASSEIKKDSPKEPEK